MCGIGGIIGDASGLDASALLAALKHRGPDRQAHVSPSPRVWLGATRLAISDPTPAGDQPMATDGGELTVVHNGKKVLERMVAHKTNESFRFSGFPARPLTLCQFESIRDRELTSAVFGDCSGRNPTFFAVPGSVLLLRKCSIDANHLLDLLLPVKIADGSFASSGPHRLRQFGRGDQLRHRLGKAAHHVLVACWLDKYPARFVQIVRWPPPASGNDWFTHGHGL